MASLLKSLRPGVPSVHDAGDDFSYEYSFAEEYKGPPLSYSIPEVLPFNLDQIPLAPVAHSPPHNLSLPVIQPFRKTNAELASRASSVSSNPLSCKEEDHDDDDDDPVSPKHVKRPSVVTFRDPETNEIVDDEEIVESVSGESNSNNSNSNNNRVRPHAERGGKKGSCYRCLKGSRLTEREIPAEDVRVNGEPLDLDQLTLLLTCSNPPKGLKPGFYWYDKASGFWGKEGQRPCQIISPQLEVGGHLQRNASNGKTEVTINGREITKKELWILKWARVPCEGTTDFWVSQDGSYMEVGQKNVKGHIWEKSTVKLASLILSLPVPSSSLTPADEGENEISKHNIQKKMLHKFLLVGSENSGTCTIYKQAKLLYNAPFSVTELQNIKLVIQSNLYRYLGIILEAREFFEESLFEKSNEQLVGESTSSGNCFSLSI
ncbi:hypothetical protein ACSQ67_021888 [Phaseolus vulgaris]